MTDFFHPLMSEQALKQCSSLALAHMGDSVYELMTRGYLIHSGLVTNKNLHRKTIHLVCAGAQAAGAPGDFADADRGRTDYFPSWPQCQAEKHAEIFFRCRICPCNSS